MRAQLDKTVQQKEQIERQQFELTLKDNRRQNELQRELDAKEAELEELRWANKILNILFKFLEAKTNGVFAH